MNDFNYYAPTKVVFGKGAEQKVGNLIKEQNCKKVLIHYGSGSADSGARGSNQQIKQLAGMRGLMADAPVY